MTINHRLYKDGDLTRAGENFAIAQQERLEAFTDEEKEQEFEKILNGLKRELEDDMDAQVVLEAIKEGIDDAESFLAEGI